MSTIEAMEWMSLDGVIQAPSYPSEDTRDGFVGGWHAQYFDDASREWVVDLLQRAGGFLLGRRTYDAFAQHWPHAGREEDAVAAPLNSKPKMVATRADNPALAWGPATAVRDPLHDAAAVARRLDGYLLLIGSGDLASQLISAGLIDRLHLMTDPVVIGRGRRLFATDAQEVRAFTVQAVRLLDTGAVLSAYSRSTQHASG